MHDENMNILILSTRTSQFELKCLSLYCKFGQRLESRDRRHNARGKADMHVAGIMTKGRDILVHIKEIFWSDEIKRMLVLRCTNQNLPMSTVAPCINNISRQVICKPSSHFFMEVTE